MDPEPNHGVDERVTLEAELRVTRDRLAQRDEVLTQLNRRLLELEQGEFSPDSSTFARIQVMRRELDDAIGRIDVLECELQEMTAHAVGLERELAAIRGTKVFRWSAPMRSVYGWVGGRR